MTDLRDGRYEGGNRDFLVEVRIDAGGSGLISADLFRATTPGHEHVSSVRIETDKLTSAAGTWRAIFQAYDGTTATGSMTVAPTSGVEDGATVTFRTDGALNVLPVRTDVSADVLRTVPEPRRLGLEIESEQGVTVPEVFSVNGGETTFPELLRRAGFQVRTIGRPTTIPRHDDGWPWDESVVYGMLDDIMRKTADDPLLPSWKVHLLQLGRPAKEGMLGVMFDLNTELPRQGCAVFVDEIRDRVPEDLWDHRILHTMAHEVGHAFNLVHRFESEVGQAGSFSVMNYPTSFLPGGEEEFWRRCTFGFDDDELSFLRHGPRSSVMPGAAPFHSVDYWGASAQAGLGPGVPTAGFELKLEPPANEAVFAYGQPIYLQVGLRNTGADEITLPPQALDVKAGNLAILAERAPAYGGEPTGGGAAFVPIVRRCLAEATGASSTLAPGDRAQPENLNLAFGGPGVPLADPGEYHLTPVLTLRGGEVVRGETLRLWVDRPGGRQEQKQAERLFEPDVAAWFALAGSDVLDRAHGEVCDVLAERFRERIGSPRPDPVAAAINRTLGIHASRSYLRLHRGDFRRRPANPEVAAHKLRGLADDAAARRCFDRATLDSTAHLVEQLERNERDRRR